MAKHADLKIAAGLAVYFCDPQSPWQRGTNENTNRLLRRHFPKGTDLSRHTADDLAAVAAALNIRLRKTLGWKTPGEALNDHPLSVSQPVLRGPLEPGLSGSRQTGSFARSRHWILSTWPWACSPKLILGTPKSWK